MNPDSFAFSQARPATLLATLLLFLIPPGAPAQVQKAFDALKQVGPEGQGNAAAGLAWSQLAAAPPSALVSLLQELESAHPRTANYLLSAAFAIVERQLQLGQPIPTTALGEFLLDPSRHPRSRRLAFDLLQRVDPTLAESLVPGFLDDPAPELRREAVQRRIDAARRLLDSQKSDAATLHFLQVLAFARDADQIESLSQSLKDLGRSVDLVKQLGFIAQWQVIGPFDNTGRAGYDRIYPPEQKIDLDADYDGKSGRVRWKSFTTDHPYGMVDFNKAYAPLKEVTGYAFTEFHAASRQAAEIRLGCKNGWKLWFNGSFLFGRDEYHRGAEIDQYRLPVELKPGRNTLLVKLTQSEETEEWTVEWEFQLRLTDPAGRVLRSAPAADTVALGAPTSPSVP